MKKVKIYAEDLRDLPFIIEIDNKEFEVDIFDFLVIPFIDELDFEEIENFELRIDYMNIKGYKIQEGDLTKIKQHIYDNFNLENY